MTNPYVCTVDSHQFKLNWLLIKFVNNNRQTMHVINDYSKNIFIGKENFKKNYDYLNEYWQLISQQMKCHTA